MRVLMGKAARCTGKSEHGSILRVELVYQLRVELIGKRMTMDLQSLNVSTDSMVDVDTVVRSPLCLAVPESMITRDGGCAQLPRGSTLDDDHVLYLAGVDGRGQQ
jgi:hypothetical protein